MARGKYLSLEEARKQKQLERFCKENPSNRVKKVFNKLFDAMALGKPSKDLKKDDG